jgi:hypothetical protein
MATAGSLSHSNVAALLGSWSSVGENVGVGTTAGDVHNALVGSPAHYQNLARSRLQCRWRWCGRGWRWAPVGR